jgi:hypothetical protein
MTDLEALKEMFTRANISIHDFELHKGGQIRGLEVAPKHTQPITFWFRPDGSLADIGVDD